MRRGSEESFLLEESATSSSNTSFLLDPRKRKVCCRKLCSRWRWKVWALIALLGCGALLGIVLSVEKSLTPSKLQGARFSFNDQFNSSLRPKYSAVQWVPTTVTSQQGYARWNGHGDIVKTSLPSLAQDILAAYADLCNEASPLKCPVHAHQRRSQPRPHPEHRDQRANLLGQGRQVSASHRRLAIEPLPEGARQEQGEEKQEQKQEEVWAGKVGASNGTDLGYDFTLSADERFVMFQTDVEPVYRWSTRSHYVLFDRAAKTFTTLADGQGKLSAAVFSPALTQHLVAYVLNNDIYILNLDTSFTQRVTTDGQLNTVINGICDWTSEEEVFSRSEAMWWAPDGLSLAFLRFSEDQVRVAQFPTYSYPYDNLERYKYPKAGQRNSVVDVGVFSLHSQQPDTLLVNRSELGMALDSYVVEVVWLSPQQVAVKVVPRLQNSFAVYSVNATSVQVVPLSTQSHPLYLEPKQAMTVLQGGAEYADVEVVGGFTHLVAYSTSTGQRTRQLTSGAWEVLAVVGYSPQLALLFFSAPVIDAPTPASGSIQRAVYSVDVGSQTPNSTIQQLSCDPSLPPDTLLRWETADFSPDGNYFVLSKLAANDHVGPNDGSDKLGSVVCSVSASSSSSWLDPANTTLLQRLTSNDDFRREIQKFMAPTRVFYDIPAVPDGGGMPMRASVLFPPGASHDCTGLTDSTPYPALVHVYGGPGSQEVHSRTFFGSGGPGFHSYLSSSHDILIVSVDPVGTGGLGDEYTKDSTYMHLGLTEARDVVGAVQWLKQQCFVDSSRVALWGWSFGGFLSSFVAAQPDHGLQAVMSVAPVTDWGLYDSVYTERYMQTPSLNPGGYANTSLLNKAGVFATNAQEANPNWLLVHGTADDNVHFQNSALLVKALVAKSQFQFSTFYYPDRAHGLRGEQGQDNPHLYRMLSHHLFRAFGMPICDDDEVTCQADDE